MAKKTFVYREDNDGRLRSIEVEHVPAVHYSDTERLMHEGTQGERVLRGYRDLELEGRYSHKPGTDNANTIKRAWSEEVTGRFR